MGGKKDNIRPIHRICLIVGIDRTEVNDDLEVLDQYHWIYYSDIKIGKTGEILL